MNLFFHPFQSSDKSMLRSHQERLETSRRLEQGEDQLVAFNPKSHCWFRSLLGKIGLLPLHEKVHVRLTSGANFANASEVARSQVKTGLYNRFQDDQASRPNCHPKLARIMEQLKRWAAFDVNGISSEIKQRWEQDALNRARTLLNEASGYWDDLTEDERALVTTYRETMDSTWNGGLDMSQINSELQQPEANNIIHRENVKQGEEYTKWDGDNIVYQVRDCSKTRFDTHRLTYNAEDQPLFPHEPCVGDVSQGALGDCYLMSALAALVSRNPQIIRNAMHDEGKTVTVRFFVPQVPAGTEVDSEAYRNARRYPLYVRVPKKTPGLIPGALGPLWVKMMERAYAASMLHLRLFMGDSVRDIDQLEEERPAYRQIEGGHSSYFLSLLTEHSTTTELTLVNERKKKLNHNLNGNISLDIALGIPRDLLRNTQSEREAHEMMEKYRGIMKELNTCRSEFFPALAEQAELELDESMTDTQLFIALRKHLPDLDLNAQPSLKRFMELFPQGWSGQLLSDRERELDDMSGAAMKELEDLDAVHISRDMTTPQLIEAIRQAQLSGQLSLEQLENTRKLMEAHNSLEVGIQQNSKDYANKIPREYQAALDRQALRKAHIIVTHRASLLGLPPPSFDTLARAEAYNSSAEVLMKAMTEVMDDYTKSRMSMEDNSAGVKELTVTHLSSLEELTDYMLDQGGMKKAALMASMQVSSQFFQAQAPNQSLMDEGDFMEQLVHDLSSKEAMQRFLQSMTKDEALHHEPFSGRYSEKALETFNTIQTAIRQGAVVTTDIHDFVFDGQLSRKLIRGLWDNHAYSIMGTVEKDGLRFVIIRNPWGMIGRRSTYKKDIQRSSQWIDLHNDGYFLMELNDYVTNYENTQIVRFNAQH